MAQKSVEDCSSKRTPRQVSINLFGCQRSLSNHFVDLQIYLSIFSAQMLFDWIDFSYLLFLFFLVIGFLEDHCQVQILSLVCEFLTKAILLFLRHYLIINLKRIQLFELSLALLLAFFLKFNTFSIEIIRRMTFSLYCSSRSLNWFLMFNICSLFLLSFHQLPLLINLPTIRWIIIFTFLLQLLLYFRYQQRFGFSITNGLIIFSRLSFFKMHLLTLGANRRIVCFIQNVFLLWSFYWDKLILDQSNDRSMQFRIKVIVYQKLLYQCGEVSCFGDLDQIVLTTDIEANLQLELILYHQRIYYIQIKNLPPPLPLRIH